MHGPLQDEHQSVSDFSQVGALESARQLISALGLIVTSKTQHTLIVHNTLLTWNVRQKLEQVSSTIDHRL